MSLLARYLSEVNFQDKQFIGTVAFRSEEISLPDGSKMALGIDDGHWVLVYQASSRAHFKVYNYMLHEDKILVDQKPGGEEELRSFKKHLNYFFAHTPVEDLVTLLPPQGRT